MEMLIIITRTIFFYFFIFIVYRLMGKREVGQLGIIDLIVSILIAELAVIVPPVTLARLSPFAGAELTVAFQLNSVVCAHAPLQKNSASVNKVNSFCFMFVCFVNL